MQNKINLDALWWKGEKKCAYFIHFADHLISVGRFHRLQTKEPVFSQSGHKMVHNLVKYDSILVLLLSNSAKRGALHKYMWE